MVDYPYHNVRICYSASSSFIHALIGGNCCHLSQPWSTPNCAPSVSCTINKTNIRFSICIHVFVVSGSHLVANALDSNTIHYGISSMVRIKNDAYVRDRVRFIIRFYIKLFKQYIATRYTVWIVRYTSLNGRMFTFSRQPCNVYKGNRWSIGTPNVLTRLC